MLEQGVVHRLSYGLVPLYLKPKALASDASKDHQLGGVDRVLLDKVIWPATIHRSRWGIAPHILGVDMTTEMEVRLIRPVETFKLLVN